MFKRIFVGTRKAPTVWHEACGWAGRQPQAPHMAEGELQPLLRQRMAEAALPCHFVLLYKPCDAMTGI